MTQNLTLDELCRWAAQNSGLTFSYSTAAQPEEYFRCALTLRFNKLLVDEFSRVVTFSDDAQNRMTFIGVTGASLEKLDNWANLTIICRKDLAIGNKDCYIFKI